MEPGNGKSDTGMFSLSKVSTLKLGTLISMVTRAASGFLDVAMGAVMARVLTIEHLGLFFLFSQFVRLWSQASSFGMPTSLLKVIGISSSRNDWTAVQITLRQSLLLLVISTLIMAVIYAAIWPLIGDTLFGSGATYLFAGLTFGINFLRAIELIGSAFFRGVRLYIFGTFLMSVPRQVGVLLVGLAFLVLGKHTDIETILALYFAVSLLLAIVIFWLMWWYMRQHSGGDGSTAENSLKEFAKLNFPFMLQAVIAEFALRIDLWVLGFVGSETDVAIYGGAQRLTLLLLFIMSSINLVLPPTLAAVYKAGDLTKLQWLTRATATASLLFALPFTLLFVLLPKTIMGVVYGPAFETGALALALLAIGRFSGAASGNRIQLLQMTGHHVLITKNSILFMVVSFVLCLTLVQNYGAEGVAAGSAISMILRNMVLAYYCRKLVGISTFPTLNPADLLRLAKIRRPRKEESRGSPNG